MLDKNDKCHDKRGKYSLFLPDKLCYNESAEKTEVLWEW